MGAQAGTGVKPLMSIKYYQDNAQAFFESTIDVDMRELYAPFTEKLPSGAKILDAGCGSGRDAKAFMSMGFDVEAIDASSELVKRARSIGINVEQKSFTEVTKTSYYDAIWACASLLHVPHNELLDTMLSLSKSLKNGGVWYVSFKYGTGQREKDGRLFSDLNESTLERLVSRIKGIEINSMWVTTDKRPSRDETWINALLRKT